MTAQQDRIITFIRDHTQRHGYPPTVREIGDQIGLTSPSSVHWHLKTLERKGYIRRADGRSRAIVVTTPKAGAA